MPEEEWLMWSLRLGAWSSSHRSHPDGRLWAQGIDTLGSCYRTSPPLQHSFRP